MANKMLAYLWWKAISTPKKLSLLKEYDDSNDINKVPIEVIEYIWRQEKLKKI